MTDNTAQPPPPLTARFEPVRRRLRSLRLAASCVATLGVLAAAILLLDGLDRLHSLRESWVLWAVGLGAALAAGVLARALLTALLRGPSARDLALDVERARPELLDSLVCAIELESVPAARRNDIERALLAQVGARLATGAPLAEVFRQAQRWRRLMLPAVIFAVCMALALHSRAWQKAVARLGDIVRGEPTGLIVQGPGSAVPEHSDVRLTAEVRRWETDAAIEYVDGEGRHRFGMNRTDQARLFFTFYDVTQALRYRVVTASLASPWQRLEIYRPPAFDAVELRVDPPAYTGREPQRSEGFRDLQAVVGSRIGVRIRSQAGVTADLRGEGAAGSLVADPDGTLAHEFTLARDTSFHVVLHSPAGWETTGPEVRIVAQPDLPPVISLLKPQRDAQAGQADTVPVEVRAADDFGLRRIVLTYAISGGERHSVGLWESGTERVLDQMAEHAFDLPALKAEAGDVISYTVMAVDNREPEAQQARTEVGFIVVRPRLDPKEMQGSQGQQQMKLDISGLIAESKRLIRFTWDTLGIPDAERQKPAEALHRDLNVLRLEVRKIFTQIMQTSGGAVAGPVAELFGNADRELSEATRLAEQKLVDEALPPQERALTALIRIENELLKNAAKGQGKGDPSPSEQQKPAEQKDGQKQSQKQTLQALREARRKAQELAERQSRLNQDLQSSGTVSPEAAKGLAEKQREVEKDTTALAKELTPPQESRRAASTLDAGAREMNQGAGRLDQSDVATAERHGRRASGLLEAAIKELDDALRKASSDRIQALAKAAGKLSDEQRAAAENSRQLAAQPQPDAAALTQAEKQQRELNQAAADLRTATGDAAAEIEESYPDASAALGEALQNANRQGLERAMGRAVNALLYHKPDKAVKPQTDAANALMEFARGLETAAGKLPGLTREELLEAIQALQQRSRETAQAMQQEGAQGQQQLEAIRRQASESLDPLAASLKDQTMQEIADQIAGNTGGDTPAETGAQMQRLFRAAIGVLERHVMAAEIKQRLDLSRRTSVPPEKYRRQVEQYFRDLGREP